MRASFILFFCFLSSAYAHISLDESYRLALIRSEDLASQEETVNQAEERLSQAKGSLLPSINGSALYSKQERPPGNNGALAPPNQSTVKLYAVQPLFRGFREYAALRQSNRLLEAGQFNKDQAKVQVFLDVVQSYYQTLQLTQDQNDLQTELDVNRKRLDELKEFRRIGRSRQTEVLTLQANVASLEAQVEAVQGQLETSKSVFAFLTGQNAAYPNQDTEGVPSSLAALDEYLSKIDHRPDVKAQIQNSMAADEGVAIARGGHLPSIDLLGDYYFIRPGFLADTHWDVQLAITVPIFSGGVTQSQVRQAASQLKQSDLALSKTRRKAAEEIESLYKQIKSDLNQVTKYKTASELSQKNYQSELKDYRLGLVTNLEVLQALTASQESQRALDRTQIQLKVDHLKLQASTAERPKL